MTSKMYDIFARMIQVLTAFPSVTRRGLIALFNLTGRLWWLVHDATQWYALFGFGAATLYVSTTGTDSPEKGTGTGTNAYRTIQYAINQVPATLFGNVTINIGAGTFREQVSVRGKLLAGNYTITFTGVDAVTVNVAATTFNSAANPAGNGSAGYGTLTKTGAGWTVNAYRNQWVEILTGTGAGQTLPIHANTADTLTITGRWGTVPSGGTFRIFALGVRVTGADAGAETTPVRDNVFALAAGQKGIRLDFLQLDYAASASVNVSENAACNLRRCRLEGGSTQCVLYTSGAQGIVQECVFLSGTHSLTIELGAVVSSILNCRFSSSSQHHLYVLTGGGAYIWESYLGAAGGLGILADNQGRVFIDAYLEVDGSAGDNLQVLANSVVVANNGYGAFATIRSINSGDWGWRATTGGFNGNASQITYATNTSGTYTPTTAPDAGST